LATALTNSGETEQALQHARRAAQLDGGDPQVQYNLGLLEDTAGDRRAAREAFEAAARLMGIKSMPLLDWWRY
jgi:Flp pilus assembly protein TadD